MGSPPKSYEGPQTAARCPECRSLSDVPALPSFRDTSGHCPECERQVEFEVIGGPTTTV